MRDLPARAPRWVLAVALAGGAAAAAVQGCGNDQAACTVGNKMSCPPDKTCEVVNGAGGTMRTQCFGPTDVHGRIGDAQSGGPLPGARVVLWNATTLQAINAGVTSSATGNYSIGTTLPRDDSKSGTISQRYGVRLSAPGYLDYPGGVRTADPVTLMISGPTSEGQKLQRDFTLQALPMGAPTGSITGHITDGPAQAAVLVVAESGGKGYSGVADMEGNYVILNVPDGTYEVRGYLKGASYGPASATVAGGAGASADLSGRTATGSVKGKATVPSGVTTCGKPGVSVAIKSTGEYVPGVAAEIKDGAYEVTDLPEGLLVVLPSQDNDCLVRALPPEAYPPGPLAGGIEHMFAAGDAFDATGTDVALAGAIDMQGPGRDSEESFGIDTLKWKKLDGADAYQIEVQDVFGKVIWGPADMGTKVDKDTDTLSPAPAKLVKGLHYKWRVTALAADKAIGRSEERRGQFFVITN